MLPKMKGSHFVKKYSVQFVNASGKLSAPFYFWDNKPHECSQTWQVVRSEFDQMMLDNAREHGVEAHEGVRVLDVLFEGDRAVGVRDAGRGRHASARCARKVVVDASGQSGAARRTASSCGSGIRCSTRAPSGPTGRAPTATPAATRARRSSSRPPTKKGWFWYIPLHDDIVSVGVVAPFDYLFKGRGRHEQTYDEEVERCPAVKERVAKATRVTGYFATKDYSYRAKEVAGDGWVLVGDAFGFLDPLYSSGVLLALRSGELAADAIGEGLAKRRHVGARSSASGGPASTRASTACAGSSASTTTASASARSCKQLSRAARHGHRPADRRPVHGPRRRGLGADGVALRTRASDHSRVARRHDARSGRQQGQRARPPRRPPAVVRLSASGSRLSPER